MSKIEEFLDNKPLFYNEIDYDRMPRVWKKIKSNFNLPKIIHIVGTNGKGSTGRFLAWHLYKSGYSVGHYSSPHILKFNERIWLNGRDIDDKSLDLAHKRLQNLLSKKDIDSLSYFEYTTLIAITIFESCQYIVLEAGLGGEYDATAVFDNILTLATTIGLDHQSFLGKDIREIAKTKLKATKNFLILGEQDSNIVEDVAKELKLEYKNYIDFFNDEELKEIGNVITKLNLSNVFRFNLALCLAALKYLNISYDLNNFLDIKLSGRVEKIASNITIDVGHNSLAARSLREHFSGKRLNLIFNTFADKDYKESLNILKPIIKKVLIIDVDNSRIEDQKELIDFLKKSSIEYDFLNGIDENEEYLVFGSFSVVESFLKSQNLEL